MTAESARDLLAHIRDILAQLAATLEVNRFARLTSELSASIDNLTGDVNDEWLEELRSAWWNIEYINATALAQQRVELTQSEHQGVEEAVRIFQILLTEY